MIHKNTQILVREVKHNSQTIDWSTYLLQTDFFCFARCFLDFFSQINLGQKSQVLKTCTCKD